MVKITWTTCIDRCPQPREEHTGQGNVNPASPFWFFSLPSGNFTSTLRKRHRPREEIFEDGVRVWKSPARGSVQCRVPSRAFAWGWERVSGKRLHRHNRSGCLDLWRSLSFPLCERSFLPSFPSIPLQRLATLAVFSSLATILTSKQFHDLCTHAWSRTHCVAIVSTAFCTRFPPWLRQLRPSAC